MRGSNNFVAGPTGFEPAISSVTGRRDRPASLRARMGCLWPISSYDDSIFTRFAQPLLVLSARACSGYVRMIYLKG